MTSNLPTEESPPPVAPRGWRRLFGTTKPKELEEPRSASNTSLEDNDLLKPKPKKWNLGILGDRETEEVPGTILLMSKEIGHNEPLGLQNIPARTSHSSLGSAFQTSTLASRPGTPRRRPTDVVQEKKKTANGQIILEPQPDDSKNDPLNWPAWRRDIALLSLGFYCMVGGGMTPVLAAGYQNVAKSYGVELSKVALTTGFYQLGLAVGSVINSPTAILFGKRPVYLVNIVIFSLTAIWCALSPNYTSLVVARVFMGLSVSPVECLPSATIAEIFFLHERAYRLGVYTLLLLGGKNIVPLVSAVIIQGLSWQWVFWIVAIIVALCFFLIFFFVPETFWDRTPVPKEHHLLRPTLATISHLFHHDSHSHAGKSTTTLGSQSKLGEHNEPQHDGEKMPELKKPQFPRLEHRPDSSASMISRRRLLKDHHVGFVDERPATQGETRPTEIVKDTDKLDSPFMAKESDIESSTHLSVPEAKSANPYAPSRLSALHSEAWKIEPRGGGPKTPGLHNFNSPYYADMLSPDSRSKLNAQDVKISSTAKAEAGSMITEPAIAALEKSPNEPPPGTLRYTAHLRTQPPKTYFQTLRLVNGRLCDDNWFRVAIRPFILFAYPSILWSTLVYSLSIGWLITLSETVSTIYRDKETYNFSALGTGLVYISPFIGGIIGTAVAGKVSDAIVKFMSKRNGGIYEPEFRLVMAIPVTISTCIGLMGFGWSAAEHDRWIIPTFFFGVISFGCSVGSTTAITFAVDSYRQYAGEALVTLNFSKNMLGLAFSLFYPAWLQSEGSKEVFIIIGCIQLACLLTTVPMYIFGKRARMWTTRKNMMEKF